MEAPAPRFDEGAAARFVADAYGLEGECSRLAGERDLNFRFDGNDGARRLLKIWNHTQDPAVIDFQMGALAHIRVSDDAIPAPSAINSRDGRPTSVAVSTDGTRHPACLLSWLDGRFAREAPAASGARASMGHWLARLDRALADYRHPAENRVMIWDLARADRLASLLPAVTPAPIRRLAEAQLQRFEAHTRPVLDTLRRQTVHGDFNLDNVLTTDDHEQVSGIIDFGDSLRTPLICELGIACAYQLDPGPDPLSGPLPLLRAYHAVCPLEPEEVALLPELIAARLTASIVITSHMAALHPENRDYLLIDNATAAQQLERLSADAGAAAPRRMLGACGLD